MHVRYAYTFYSIMFIGGSGWCNVKLLVNEYFAFYNTSTLRYPIQHIYFRGHFIALQGRYFDITILV